MEGVEIELINALKRLKGSAPRVDFYKYKHEDCANFDNGTCKVAHFTNVNPKETVFHILTLNNPEIEKKYPIVAGNNEHVHSYKTQV